jgi:hypothetical protein
VQELTRSGDNGRVSSTNATPVGPSDGGSGPPGEGSQNLEHRHERIRVETPRHRIEGSMILARDGYRSRVSDVLNASERDFLTLTDVTLQPLDGGPVEQHDFLAVARAHIVFAVSAPEEVAAPPPAPQV